MAVWPLNGGANLQEAGTLASSRPPMVTVTGSGTAHTKGSWFEIVTATGTTWQSLELIVARTFVSGADSSTLLDIGFGGSGSEVVVVADLPIGYRNGPANAGVGNVFPLSIPLRVPAGTRIAARLQSTITSKAVDVGIVGVYGQGMLPEAPFPRCTTYGTVAATSKGVSVTGSASANTYGSWAQIVASTTLPIHALLVRVSGNGNTGLLARNIMVKIGVGAAASEVQVGPQLFMWASDSEWIEPQTAAGLVVPIPGLSIPTGSRLAAAVGGSTAAGAIYDVTAIGFTY